MWLIPEVHRTVTHLWWHCHMFSSCFSNLKIKTDTDGRHNFQLVFTFKKAITIFALLITIIKYPRFPDLWCDIETHKIQDKEKQKTKRLTVTWLHKCTHHPTKTVLKHLLLLIQQPVFLNKTHVMSCHIVTWGL